MAVSKSLRFQILRRDNHACRYCGAAAAPEKPLTVDHVVPVAHGGSDDPGNLVAACRDCNAGKSATPADAALVTDVSQDALRWADALRRAYDKRLGQIDAENDYLGEFYDKWNSYTFAKSGSPVDLPGDWERTVTHWYGLGLPIGILTNAVDKAMTKFGLKGFDAEFRYMAGVVWSVVKELQEEAAASLATPEPDPHCPAGCGVHDPDRLLYCHVCGNERCGWACGWLEGRRDAFAQIGPEAIYAMRSYAAVSAVCDRV